MKDKPCFIMLWSLVGHGITTLLGQRLFCLVLRIFKAFVLHADILQESRVCPVFFSKNLFILRTPRPAILPKTASLAHLVQQFSSLHRHYRS
jgi:hypothetical protein